MNVRGHCSRCNRDHPVPKSHVGKAVGGPLGAFGARLVSKSPWAPVIGSVVGILAGELADRTILPRCPTCGAMLELIDTALS